VSPERCRRIFIIEAGVVSQWLGHSHLETTLIYYAHADTEHKRRAIANATTPNDPMYDKLNPARFIVSDEETLKRLYGLKRFLKILFRLFETPETVT